MSSLQISLRALLACAVLSASALAGEELPRPPGLEPEIGFWRRIFAECTTEQGLIHDNRELGIVYEKIDVANEGGVARIARVAESARGRYERILRKLASGKDRGLSAEEERVRDLWPSATTTAEFRAAAERVRFQQGLADRFFAGLLRSGQWEQHIRETLREAGVPEDLVALPHVESSFDPNARSFVGAAGLWQFTADTGRRFMRIDSAVDERRDPYESSEAAASLLRYNYSVLGTWPLAITAYNHGTAGMRRAAEQMGTTDIETIIRRYNGRAFGFASRNFYVSFLAALEIEKDAEKYFGTVQRKSPRADLVVELPDYVRVDTLERTFGVSRATLQAYNPSLLPPVWEGAKYVPRGFRLRLPASDVIDPAPRQALAAIPQSERFASQVPDRTHRVKRGDTLSHIARRYGTTVSRIAQANGIQPGSRIRVGQVLKLPVRPGAAPAPVAVASAEPPPAPVAPQAAAAGASPPAPGPGEVYVVRPGDSLERIARRTGVGQRELLAFNDIRDPNRVRSGQTLRLQPPAGTASLAADGAGEAAGAGATAEEPALDARDPTPASPGEAGRTAASLADPNDYLVADDDTVEVQAAETMSHYADWLEVSSDELRRANGWSRQRPLVLGHRVKLVFANASRETFLSRRVAYHHDLQDDYFSRYRITTTTEHRLRRGESVWVLASQKYKVPVWLLRQYNPGLNLDQVRPGMRVVFPRVERIAPEGDGADGVADVG